MLKRQKYHLVRNSTSWLGFTICLESLNEKVTEDDLKVVAHDEEGLEEHDFHRVAISGGELIGCSGKDHKTASGLILDALRFREKYMSMAGQTYSITTSRYLAKVDGGEEPPRQAKVAPVCPYEDRPHPYEGNWKETLLPNLNLKYKMKQGCLEIFANEADIADGNKLDDYHYPGQDYPLYSSGLYTVLLG